MATASRKEAILEAARGEFAGNGYSGARVERIAASAGTNKQLIFHYFGSKDGLYSAVVASTFDGAPIPPQNAATPTELVRRYVSDIASWFAGTPGAALLAAECGADGRPVPEEAARIVAASLDLAMGGIKAAIDDGQRKGYFRDDIDPQFVAELVVSSAIGNALVGPGAATWPARESAPKFASFLAQVAVDLCAWR